MNWKRATSILTKNAVAVPLLWASVIMRSFSPVEHVSALDAASPLINVLGWAALLAGGYLALTALPALIWVGKASTILALQYSQPVGLRIGAIAASAARDTGFVIGLILKIIFWPVKMLVSALWYGVRGIVWLIGKGLSLLWRAIVFVLRPVGLALTALWRGLSAVTRLVRGGFGSVPKPAWWLVGAALIGVGLVWLGQMWPPLLPGLGAFVAFTIAIALVSVLLIYGLKLLWNALTWVLRHVLSPLKWPFLMLAKLVGWLFDGLRDGLASAARPFVRVRRALVDGMRLIRRGVIDVGRMVVRIASAGVRHLMRGLALMAIWTGGALRLLWKALIWLADNGIQGTAIVLRKLRQLALPIGRGLRRLWRAVVWVVRLLFTVLVWPIVMLTRLVRWLFGRLEAGLTLLAEPARWIGQGLARLGQGIVRVTRLIVKLLIWPFVTLAKLIVWLFDRLSKALSLLARPFVWAGRKLSGVMRMLGDWLASALHGMGRIMALPFTAFGKAIVKITRWLARGVAVLFAPVGILLRRVVMRKENIWIVTGVSSMVLIVVYYLSSCSSQVPTPAGDLVADPNTFRIVAEHDVLNLEDAGLFEEFTKETGIGLTVTYRGPVDIRDMVAKISKENPKTVDAFWPASTLWLSGSSSVSPETVMKTYVVLAVDPATATELGWASGQRITAADLVGAVQAGKIKLAMTSATQSTPGAVFYLAMYTALSGKPVLTTADLEDPATLDSLKTLLNGIDRSAAEVDHLKDVFVEDKVSGKHTTNAIVIYESLAIQMNQELVAAGQPPMLIYYVEGATAIADAPLRYVDNGDDLKLEQYWKFVEFLQREDIVNRIQLLGWRTNQIGMGVDSPDPAVFNPAWGVDTAPAFQEMIFPKPPAARGALEWYQVYGRKPSFTVYCLDYSGSMSDNGGDTQMTDAMDLLLDQTRAANVSLQASEQDVTVVYAFSGSVVQIGSQAIGNDPAVLKQLSTQVSAHAFGGGTAMFDCLKLALGYVGNHYEPATYAYSIIAMTDGASNQGATAADFNAFHQQGGYTVPVYGIAFGSPDFSQLNELAKTGGAVYDGRQDIALAFRAAKGNN